MNAGTILALAGGLGLFLYGMEMMSEGIEKAAGAKLRSIVEMFTKNKFMGLIVGVIFTGLVQSSSACTVMVVSFVNSGLMSLYQAVGVILGANIGTTITSQLVSINLSEIAPVFVFGGALAVMFSKNEKTKKIGAIFLGFGILFTGLNTMSGAMKGLRDDPQVVGLLASMSRPLVSLLVGFGLTAIIQSSSVTVSIVLLLASQGLLSIYICPYIVLGCNIGSCVSALLASLAGKKEAKRAAMIHFMFNVIGSAILFVIFMFALNPLVDMLFNASGQNPGRFVANAHTLMKVFQVIVLFPFSNQLVKLTYMLVPGDDKKVGDTYTLKFIGDKVVFNPTTAVIDVIHELERMAEMARENLNRAMNALLTLDKDEIDRVFQEEKNIDFLNRAITDYLVKINQTTLLPTEDLKSIAALFHVANDIERIGDHAANIAEDALKRNEEDISISKKAQKELSEMLEMVNSIFSYSVEMFAHGKEDHLQDIVSLENEIDEKERELQKAHVSRLTKNKCTPQAGMIFSDVVSGLERVADHATNIAFSIHEKDGVKYLD
ncbi:MAG: Na/Pi cotransporter family protein [Lachnospiraceae bacterium]|nr:Na/Pi cotransporter family protein [Lachnospiraceae bacterium]